jgi:hypothetical protein
MWIATDPPAHPVRNVVLLVVTMAVCALAGCMALYVKSSQGMAGAQQQIGAAAPCQGRTYPDQRRDHDVCANAAGTVALNGISVTATPLARDAAGNLCSTVHYVNNTDHTVSANPRDWRLRAPNGQSQDSAAPGRGDLTAGEVVKGGDRDGTVCFNPVTGGGTFVVVYQAPVEQLRGIWLTDLP